MLTFKAHDKPVYGVAFSPDGQFLLTSSGDQTVKLWACEGPELIRELPGSQFAAPVAFSPDGRFVARGGYGVEVWECDSGKSVISAAYPEMYGETLAFAPDGTEFAAFGTRKPLRRWSLPGGTEMPGRGDARWASDESRFTAGAVAYSADGSVIATSFGVNTFTNAGYASHVFLWDRTTGTPRGELKANYAYNHPTAITFSPDGSALAGIYGPVLQVFDTRDGSPIATHKPGTKHYRGLAFTPNGRRLVTVSNDRSVRLYDTGTWAEAAGYEWKVGRLGCVAVAPDGLRMAAGGDTGKVVVWDVDL